MTETMSNIVENPTVSGVFAIPTRHRKRAASLSQNVITEITQFADLVTVMAASAYAFWAYDIRLLGKNLTGIDRYALTTILGALLFVSFLRRYGGYELRRLVRLRSQINGIVAAWFFTVSVLAIASFVIKNSVLFSRGWSIAWAFAALGGLAATRVTLRAALHKLQRGGRLTHTVAIVGAGPIGRHIITKIEESDNVFVTVTGLFDDRSERIERIIRDHPVRGTIDDLIHFARRNPIDEIIIALPTSAAQRIGQLVDRLKSLSVDIRLAIGPELDALPILRVGQTGPVPVIEIIDKPLKHWNAVAKRLEDIVLAGILTMLLLPVFALIAMAIKFTSDGPVLFVQDRFGFNNMPVQILKFRTMYIHLGDPTGACRTVRGDPRVTPIGWFIRATSLDELPQLFNVLRGEMSLVGPRPHAVAMRAGDGFYHETVGAYALRHRVRPGLTGWAQVSGFRGEVDTIEKASKRVEHDLYYIDNWSLWLDAKILLMTFRELFRHENAY